MQLKANFTASWVMKSGCSLKSSIHVSTIFHTIARCTRILSFRFCSLELDHFCRNSGFWPSACSHVNAANTLHQTTASFCVFLMAIAFLINVVWIEFVCNAKTSMGIRASADSLQTSENYAKDSVGYIDSQGSALPCGSRELRVPTDLVWQNSKLLADFFHTRSNNFLTKSKLMLTLKHL